LISANRVHACNDLSSLLHFKVIIDSDGVSRLAVRLETHFC